MRVLAAMLALAAQGPAGPEVAATVEARPVSVAEVHAEVRRLKRIEPGVVRQRFHATAALVERLWFAGEAAALGIEAGPQDVAAVEARERARLGRRFVGALRADGYTLETWRTAVEAAVRRRRVVDRMYVESPDARVYDARFAAFRATWRARTTCARRYAVAEVCANRPEKADDRCETLGVTEICLLPLPGERKPFWSIFDDVAGDLGEYNNHDVQDAVHRRLRHHHPGLDRRIELDSEAGFFGAYGSRAALTELAWVLHGMALRRPLAPLIARYEE